MMIGLGLSHELHYFDLLYNESTTNRSNGVCAIQRRPIEPLKTDIGMGYKYSHVPRHRHTARVCFRSIQIRPGSDLRF